LEKKAPQQKLTQLTDKVNFVDKPVDLSNKENSPPKKGNNVSKRNSACTVANQDISP